MKKLRTIIVMPAFNSEKTLRQTFENIPKDLACEIILIDDKSMDKTVETAKSLGIRVFKHGKNKGYGGNQKTCYKKALKQNADIVVMLHPDNQYDSSLTAELIKPIENKRFDIMFGSRIRTRKEALQGGMPYIKYLLNRILSFIENIILGVNFTEHLSGFRAYSAKVLNTLPIETFSDDFVFDQQFMISAISYGFTISEYPVPVRYLSESSSINYIKGAKFLLETFYVLFRFILYNLNIVECKWFKKKISYDN